MYMIEASDNDVTIHTFQGIRTTSNWRCSVFRTGDDRALSLPAQLAIVA